MSTVKIGNRVRYNGVTYVVLDRAPARYEMPPYGAPVHSEYLRVTGRAESLWPVAYGSGPCWWLQDVADPHRFVRARENEILPESDDDVVTQNGLSRAIMHRTENGWIVHKPFGHLPTTVYTVTHGESGKRLAHFRGLRAAKSAADTLPALPDTSDRAAVQSVVDLAKSLPGYYLS